jgi:SRSO17 transposase
MARGQKDRGLGSRGSPQTHTGDAPSGHRVLEAVAVQKKAFRTKPEIAIEEIGRIKGIGVRFGRVLADAGYGLSAVP